MSLSALRQPSYGGETVLPSSQNQVVYPENAGSQKCRMLCRCAQINSKCGTLLARVSKNIRWLIGRTRELKVKEIPYFLTHPRLIINLLYRERVKRVMANLQAERKVATLCTTLSKIEPSHPIKGNFYAERTCRERIDVLKTHHVEFTRLLKRNDPITEKLLDKLLRSTSPIQCAFDETRKKYISFNGTGRLFALKSFFQKEFSGYDPKIEISVFHVHPDLLKRAVSE